ncbi:DUF362 domain-containing protein [Brachyspira pulli]|uniref:DUF362 domain-containing protein n=1 Tax=Brachyspira pulli TaxID=310721 RepID=UPI0030057FDD
MKAAISKSSSYDINEINNALDILFESLDMDIKSPFKNIINPGMKVFIKPNWVASRWRESCDHKDDIYCVITHHNIIEAVCDRVVNSLEGKGKIYIGDNPSIDADFNELMDLTNIKRLEKKYEGIVEILDLRPLYCDDLKNYGKKYLMKKQTGDPNGGQMINLGKNSLFYGMDPKLFRGVFDEREDTIKSHTGDNQLYTFSSSIYNSDLYISIPKLKTHHKTGVTLNLKGLVGSIIDKNQLVHWKVGYPEVGGDEYPSEEIYNKMQNEKIQERGAWPGNDTIWRMVCDLYEGFCLKKGKNFTIIDGILGGEGQGPFCPHSVHSNSIIASSDLLIGDIVATRYMGIDPYKINYLNYFIKKNSVILSDIKVFNEGKIVDDFFNNQSKYLNFNVKDVWKKIKI